MKWIFALVVTCSFAARSADLPVITVTGLNVEPYIIKTEGSKSYSGIMIDIVNEVISRVEHQADYNITVWARAYNDVIKGHKEALIPAMKTEERERLLWYPEEPLLSLRMSLFKAKGADLAWNGALTSLQGASISVVRGAKVSPDFDQAMDSGLFKVEKRTDFDLVMLAVAAKRADYGAADQLMGIWAAKNNGISNDVEIAEPYLAEVPVYIAFSKEKVDAKFVSRFNKELVEFKREGGVQKIIDSYFNNDTL